MKKLCSLIWKCNISLVSDHAGTKPELIWVLSPFNLSEQNLWKLTKRLFSCHVKIYERSYLSALLGKLNQIMTLCMVKNLSTMLVEIDDFKGWIFLPWMSTITLSRAEAIPAIWATIWEPCMLWGGKFQLFVIRNFSRFLMKILPSPASS